MKQKEYRSLLVCVKLTNSDINTLKENSFEFIKSNGNIVMKYHEFTIFLEDYKHKKYTILSIFNEIKTYTINDIN